MAYNKKYFKLIIICLIIVFTITLVKAEEKLNTRLVLLSYGQFLNFSSFKTDQIEITSISKESGSYNIFNLLKYNKLLFLPACENLKLYPSFEFGFANATIENTWKCDNSNIKYNKLINHVSYFPFRLGYNYIPARKARLSLEFGINYCFLAGNIRSEGLVENPFSDEDNEPYPYKSHFIFQGFPEVRIGLKILFYKYSLENHGPFSMINYKYSQGRSSVELWVFGMDL